jgi:hypothetical protein
MPEAWIQLHCPACSENWERSPSDLPTPGTEFECPHCGAHRQVAEFMKTQRDLEIHREFHGG